MPRARLSAVARPGAREGALIRIDDGFADVHPWPELGDAPLDEQLALLARGETTTLTRCSLRFAALDGDARGRGVSLFERLRIPESHWPGAEPPPEFDTVKIKDVAVLPPNVRLRIDLNARSSSADFLRMRLPRERVEFVEDPCPYDPRVWNALRAKTGMRLALDRGVATGGVDVLVMKPAVQLEMPDVGLEVVVTSYMDHPVGQFGAAYVAAMAAPHLLSKRCGLVTHVLYEPDAFIERIRMDGARLVPPEGTGIGFDDLLERLPWKKLA